MSRVHSSPDHSPPNPVHPLHHGLASVAKTLQEAAQSLIDLSTAIPPDEAIRGNAEIPVQQDEYRSYRVPFHILDDEQELLAEYGKGRIAHVLRDIYTEFYLMLELMQGYAERNDDEDFTYVLVAQHLLKPLDSLSKVCSVLVDFELQATETMPKA